MFIVVEKNNFIKVFYNISTILGHSVPNLKNYKGLGIFYVGYVILLIVIIASWDGLLIYQMVNNGVAVSSDYNILVLKLLEIISLGIANITTILSIVFIQRRRYLQVYFSIKRLDAIFYQKFGDSITYEGQHLINICILIFTFIGLNDFLYFIYISVDNDHGNILVYCITLFQKDMLYLAILQILFLQWIINCITKCFSEHYLKLLIYDRGKENNYYKVNFFLQKFEDIYQSMDHINKTYYTSFICICINAILQLMNGISLIITMCTTNIGLEDMNLYVSFIENVLRPMVCIAQSIHFFKSQIGSNYEGSNA